MSRKTKAQLEQELKELQDKLSRIESGSTVPSAYPWVSQWAPAILVGVALAGLVLFQRASPDGPEPKPDTELSIESVAREYLPALKSVHKETFSLAADAVKSKEIKTDQELFDFVRPALERLREEKRRPFDKIFDLSLPRNDDGSFTGHESEVEDFLRRIAQSW